MSTSDFTPRPYANQLEIWRDIGRYEGYYQISNLGHVKTVKVSVYTKTGRILKPGLSRGYPLVTLCKDGKRQTIMIHRLVAETFLGDPPTPLHEVNHKNSDRSDNRLENLEWVTRKENIEHSIKVGKGSNVGELSPNAKLNWKKVKEIRKLHSEGISAYRLSKVYGVAHYTITSVIKNRTWVESKLPKIDHSVIA